MSGDVHKLLFEQFLEGVYRVELQNDGAFYWLDIMRGKRIYDTGTAFKSL